MKAAIREEYGTVDVLQVKEMEVPTPKKDEVLVKVHCTTVNRTDCATVSGKPYIFRLFIGMFRPTLPITGTDFAGEIVAIGEDVSQFKTGDHVFGLNDEGLSSHAEYMTIKETAAIAKISPTIKFSTAAASAEGAHYSLNFLNKVEVNPGDKILVNGATGAIGSATIQLLKLKGVHVTAVCDTKNIELVKSTGVDKVISYEVEDFTKTEQKYDFVLDSVGKSRFKHCKRILKEGGIYVSSELGPFAENIFLALKAMIFGSKKVIFPIPNNPRKSIKHMAQLLNDGKFNPFIDRIYPLYNIKEAFSYVQTGMKTGNVILKIAEESM